ncbi:hypothetical protein JY651_47775 [Pyxidicoccus parkwayensis]|uniref:Lipoprotein n=1 Tax=Pyxidicoccus parkwayensis TaxID=2813578 RepID=A0ABX7NUX4_9BACT|nr:hypothetical protein [Pyxidicoccus parkwaysis]QSQ22721.1 hypothetical protein JY651_47775 [Pyxidicoccus parkwaysis]
MKSTLSGFAVLAAGFLMACGGEPQTSVEEPAAPVISEGAPTDGATGQVSAQACVQLYRPRYSAYYSSLPISEDNLVASCFTNDDCTTECTGSGDGPYYTHSGFFYCTYCP